MPSPVKTWTVEDPKQAKGLVKREVTRIVTPGTNLNVQSLEETKNNFLMSIAYFPNKIGISVADVTTGDYYLTEVEDGRKLMDEVNKYLPSEIICNDAFLVSGVPGSFWWNCQEAYTCLSNTGTNV